LAVYDVETSTYLGCYEENEQNAVALVRLRDGDEKYAKDGSFSVSFWFTHNHCENINATGQWEPLYHHGYELCDGCPMAAVDVFLACEWATSIEGQTVNGTFISVTVSDDDGQFFLLDIPFGEQTQDNADTYGGAITDMWVHFALAVDGDKAAVYIDGAPVTRYGITPAFSDGNLAVGHVRSRDLRRADGVIDLESRLGSITFGEAGTVCINTSATPSDVTCEFDGLRQDADGNDVPVPTGGRGMQMDCPSSCKIVGSPGVWLGTYFGNWMPSFFNGVIANLGIYRRMLSKEDVSCLYKYGETHLGVDPMASLRG
jgi:hypothetical protein